MLYRVLTLGFKRPSPPGVTSATSAGARAALEAAALLDSRRAAAEPLLPAVEALTGLATPSVRDLDEVYARLFGHTCGLICPFETEYGMGAWFRQPHELADIAGYYLAFGLRPAVGIDERVDHVACECEFMDFLARKEAFVLASGRAAGGPTAAEAIFLLEAVRAAGRRFLRDHLARFGRAFAARLMREDEGGFFGRAGAVLFCFLGLDCERLGVPPGPPTLELRPPAPDDVPMTCGASCGVAAELIQIQRRGGP